MNEFQHAAEAIRNAEYVVAVTGAGISVESGIPDFRGPHGIWERFPPEEYATIDAFKMAPGKFWRFWIELENMVAPAQPNPAHKALADLERMGRLKAIITQNIDNLHEQAGSTRVVEYHGNAHYTVCMSCGARRAASQIDREHLPPRCGCMGLIKPDVVLFGEMIPTDALFQAEQLAQQCDVLIVVGTSAQVFPAAQLPFTAKRHGAYVIESNIVQTDFTDSVTDAFLEGKAGETLPRLVELLRGT